MILTTWQEDGAPTPVAQGTQWHTALRAVVDETIENALATPLFAPSVNFTPPTEPWMEEGNALVRGQMARNAVERHIDQHTQQLIHMDGQNGVVGNMFHEELPTGERETNAWNNYLFNIHIRTPWGRTYRIQREVTQRLVEDRGFETATEMAMSSMVGAVARGLRAQQEAHRSRVGESPV